MEPSSQPTQSNTLSGSTARSVIHQLLNAMRPSPRSGTQLASRSQLIQVAKGIVDALDPRSIERSQLLEALAHLLYDHYEDVNEWDALEQATDYLGDLIENTDDDDLPRSSRLSYSYSRCLRSRFMRGRNEEDLENAIEFATQSVDKTRQIQSENDIPLLAIRQGNLWLCLFTKAHQVDECPPDVLDEAIRVAEGVERMLIENKIKDKPWIEARANLALSYQIRWDQRSTFEDLERSVQLGYEVIDLLPADADADARLEALSNLAFRLQRAYHCYLVDQVLPTHSNAPHGEALADEAFKYIDESMSIQGDRILSRPENALTFVTYISNFPPESGKRMLGRCYNFLKLSVQLLRDICLQSSKADQQDNLATFYGISRYAAAAALEAESDVYHALCLLEEGRGITLSSQFDISQDIQAISSYDQDLADRYSKAKESFKSAVIGQEAFYTRHERMSHLQAVQDEIRAIPGFDHPSSVLSKDEMIALADQSDIVVINITDIRSDAIIISKGNIRALNLPNLDETSLSEASWEIQTRLAKEDDQEEVFHDLHKGLSKLLGELWKNLARPVLSSLGYTEQPSLSEPWPHIWWVPTGVLSLYPIHAAGLGLHKKANAMNRVISSYAPSLRVLSFIRNRDKEIRLKLRLDSTKGCSTTKSSAVAVIAMHDTPARQPLEYSRREADKIESLFPDCKTLHQPTTQDALELIGSGSPIVHLSCHGETDYDYPSKSALLMVDWESNPLTVSDLQLLDIKTPQLAFLSACFTANAGVENLQDEVTHVAGALQIAGFPNVIGSLWYVGQEAAFAVIERFYGRISKREGELNPRIIAEALHFAVLEFSETTRIAGNRMQGDPVSWAPFVHFGA